ncbi:unnamed protein product [Kuraishia capsulata CBS 1993]|uniref:Chromo domain-containing protein 1 n=1 Tax=Kuraishia capsulata CBS 1993 TaxID=1382522 RepID=W6MIQ3_9ASCO|nr:uncharacterized protein KUCA_T00000222001 [Kuraishia capsulata CBS 1993]CDK24262.1 unnamed protein product [Kuraishia capsulata CBS 1993]
MTEDIKDEISRNPELYGLRRSGRARAPASSFAEISDSDEDVRPTKRSKKQKNVNADEFDDDEDEDDDEDDEFYDGESAQKKRKLNGSKSQRSKSKSSRASEPAYAEVRFSSRNSKTVNYAVDEDDEAEFMESDAEQAYEYDGYSYADEPEGTPLAVEQAIDQILDHRVVGEAEGSIPDDHVMSTDGTGNGAASASDEEVGRVNYLKLHGDPKQDFEFLVKWVEVSHLHNTWEKYDSLHGLKGGKKVDNYINQFIVLDRQIRADPTVTREDIESMDLEADSRRDELKQFIQVERIVESDRVLGEDGTSELQYLCKWKRLYYDECTWESADEIVKIAPEMVKQYQSRKNSKILPNLSASYGTNRPRFEKLVAQPAFVKNGELRDFQLTGLNWMAFLWSRNENGILADEMGLGKTVQTVSFLSWLIYARRQNGPHLVVVPLSTVPAWQETFEKWSPDLNCIYYMGNAKSRKAIRDFEFYGSSKKPKFNILLTTYEYILKDRSELGSFKWQFMAVDEAHRLKNAESSLYESLKEFKISNRLLITGTPLQNNIKELAALCNFLMPGKFNIEQEIDFESPDADAEEYIQDLQKKIHPFILRRLKKDVEKSLPAKTERILRVELSDLQTQYYKNVLTKNYSALTQGVKGAHISLLNVMSELKKASNHPYLFDQAEEAVLTRAGGSHSRENILRGMIMSSGKMVLLDKLLTRLRKDGHRVLIFSQMVRMLDILGDYLSIKGYNFQRLDGTIPSAQRRVAIDHFNADGSQDFVFLLSTRAGGLGINLMTADTVIIFDSDWNPQADLQAMARAHRIGQKNHVMVYRFVSKDTVEEEVLERARKKMILEYAIISLGITDKQKKKNEPSNGELSEILKFGAGNMFKANENQKKLEDLNLDDVLNHAEDHVTTPDLGESNLGGEEFLKQFEVTDYKADVDWDDIIPEEELKKLKEDEKKRQDEQYLQQQIEMYSRRQAAMKSMRGVISDNEDDDDEPKTKSRKKRAVDMNKLTESEIRGIYRAILKYGELSDKWDELTADGTLSNKNSEVLKATYHDLISESKELVAKEEKRRAETLAEMERKVLEEKEKEREKEKAVNGNGNAVGNTASDTSSLSLKETKDSPAMTLWMMKRRERKAILFEFRGAKNINAELVLSRPEDMALLKTLIPKDDPYTFKLPKSPKPVHGWTCEWSVNDDSMLLVGVDKFGYGSWAQIRDDPLLGLQNKVYLETPPSNASKEEKDKFAKRSPGAVHLGRRVDYLFNLLKGKEDEENDESESPAPVRKRARKPKKAQTPEVSDIKKVDSPKVTPKPRAKPTVVGGETKPKAKPRKKEKVLSPLTSSADLTSSSATKVKHEDHHGPSSGATVEKKTKPEVKINEEVCREKLAPVYESLKRLKAGAGDLDKKHWAKILKKELITVGDHITKTTSSIPPEARDHDKKQLWAFACLYWPAKVPSSSIMNMYARLSQPDKKESTPA